MEKDNIRFMKGKKGYTPILAVVLLLVMSIMLFFLVSTWSKGYTKNEVEEMGDQMDKELKCSNAGIRIRKYDLNTEEQHLTIYLRNVGQIDLSQVRISFTDSEGLITTSNETIGLPADRQDYLFQVDIDNTNIPIAIRAMSECPKAQDVANIAQ